MLPGVNVDALPSFTRGQLCSVSVPGNPAPFAVCEHPRDPCLQAVARQRCSATLRTMLANVACIRY